MRLTDAQMNGGRHAQLAEFDARIAAMLLATYAETHQIVQSEFAASVTAARAYAQSLGFRSERHLFDLVEALLLNGGALKHDPELRKILDRPLLNDEEKCLRIRARFVTAHPAYKEPETPE